LTYAEYAKAILGNGLGDYESATDAARAASGFGELAISPWALYELVEGASRCDQREAASAAAHRLSEIAVACGSSWAYGAAARSHALLAEGPAAEDLFREAIDRLRSTRVVAHLARARLSYGEWLRRENRRMDARDQLRPALEAFASMGAAGFAARARRELQATGERARTRDDSTRSKLTAQETEIAELARQRRTNAEIGAQLFLSARTVEWHLRKVFSKLGISSRRELDDALGIRGGRPGSTPDR
jgi:DNA-binding CsgD family transcriptional regulator